MPMERVEQFARLLGLSAAETLVFKRAAGMTHAPPVVQEMVDEITRELREVRSRYETLAEEVRKRRPGAKA